MNDDIRIKTRSQLHLKRLSAEPPPTSQRLAKFSVHKSFNTGNVNLLNCHMMSMGFLQVDIGCI